VASLKYDVSHERILLDIPLGILAAEPANAGFRSGEAAAIARQPVINRLRRQPANLSCA
jgi:hypothetical protein